jgi:hypothetical protein
MKTTRTDTMKKEGKEKIITHTGKIKKDQRGFVSRSIKIEQVDYPNFHRLCNLMPTQASKTFSKGHIGLPFILQAV